MLQVVQKSTVADASTTRALLERMEPRNNLSKHDVGSKGSDEMAEQMDSLGKCDLSQDGELNQCIVINRSTHELHVRRIRSIGNMLTIIFQIPKDESSIDVLQQRFEEVMQLNLSEQRVLELKWSIITDSIAAHASELAESLRMIIEPTIASRLE